MVWYGMVWALGKGNGTISICSAYHKYFNNCGKHERGDKKGGFIHLTQYKHVMSLTSSSPPLLYYSPPPRLLLFPPSPLSFAVRHLSTSFPFLPHLHPPPPPPFPFPFTKKKKKGGSILLNLPNLPISPL